jgi:hypothetical protein
MKSEDLKEKLDDFIQLFGSSSDKVKKQVNYYSTVNIATELIRMENISNAKPYRVIISEYFDLNNGYNSLLLTYSVGDYFLHLN